MTISKTPSTYTECPISLVRLYFVSIIWKWDKTAWADSLYISSRDLPCVEYSLTEDHPRISGSGPISGPAPRGISGPRLAKAD